MRGWSWTRCKIKCIVCTAWKKIFDCCCNMSLKGSKICMYFRRNRRPHDGSNHDESNTGNPIKSENRKTTDLSHCQNPSGFLGFLSDSFVAPERLYSLSCE